MQSHPFIRLTALLLIPAMLITYAGPLARFAGAPVVDTAGPVGQRANGLIAFSSQALATPALSDHRARGPAYAEIHAEGIMALREDPVLVEGLNRLLRQLDEIRHAIAPQPSDAPTEQSIRYEMRRLVNAAIELEDEWLGTVADWALGTLRTIVRDEMHPSAVAILFSHHYNTDPLAGEVLARLAPRMAALIETAIRPTMMTYKFIREFIEGRNAFIPGPLFHATSEEETSELKFLLLQGLTGRLITYQVFQMQLECPAAGWDVFQDQIITSRVNQRAILAAMEDHLVHDLRLLGLYTGQRRPLYQPLGQLPSPEERFPHVHQHLQFLKTANDASLESRGLDFGLLTLSNLRYVMPSAFESVELFFNGLRQDYKGNVILAINALRRFETGLRKAGKAPRGKQSATVPDRAMAPAQRAAVGPLEARPDLSSVSTPVHNAMMDELDRLNETQRSELRKILGLIDTQRLPSREDYTFGRLSVAWFQKLHEALVELGVTESIADPPILFKTSPWEKLPAVVHPKELEHIDPRMRAARKRYPVNILSKAFGMNKGILAQFPKITMKRRLFQRILGTLDMIEAPPGEHTGVIRKYDLKMKNLIVALSLFVLNASVYYGLTHWDFSPGSGFALSPKMAFILFSGLHFPSINSYAASALGYDLLALIIFGVVALTNPHSIRVRIIFLLNSVLSFVLSVVQLQRSGMTVYLSASMAVGTALGLVFIFLLLNRSISRISKKAVPWIVSIIAALLVTAWTWALYQTPAQSPKPLQSAA